MALRDWEAWQIGIVWAFGIGIAWLVGRLGVAAVSGEPAAGEARVTGTGAPLWTTAVILVIVAALLFVTVRWFRGRVLDQ